LNPGGWALAVCFYLYGSKWMNEGKLWQSFGLVFGLCCVLLKGDRLYIGENVVVCVGW